jgi:hypothetical protein
LFQRAPRIRIQHASEIGTAQIVAPVARLAGNLADLQAASRARAWSSVKASSASVGRLAPERPSPTRAGVSSRKASSERDGGAGVFMGFYSAGTEASRSRIE